MELDLVLAGPGGQSTAVTAQLGADATVADLAGALAAFTGTATPGRPPALYAGGRRLRGRQPVARAGLVHGATVSLGRPLRPEGPPSAPLTLAVVGGLAGGETVAAGPGEQLSIGRSPAADLVVDDPEVSRTHATVRMAAHATVRMAPAADAAADGCVAELRDAGSRNGTSWAGYRLEGTAHLGAGDLVGLGESVVALRSDGDGPAVLEPGPEPGTTRYHRPPRILVRPEPEALEVPAEPEPPRSRRFPLAVILLPLVLGAVVLAIPPLRQRIGGYLLFLALSPLMGLAYLITDRRSGRHEYRQKKATYDAAMAALDARVRQLVVEDERGSREALPDPAAVVSIATRPTGRLWERRPTDDDFLLLRVGLGDRPAAVVLQGGDRKKVTPPPARAVPVAVDVAKAGVVGVAAPRSQLMAMARALVAQAATLHTPRDLSIVVLTGADEGEDWEWTALLPHTRPGPGEAGSRRLTAVDRDQGEARLDELRRLIKDRAEVARSVLAAGPPAGPRVLVVLDGAQRLRTLRGLAEVLREGPAAGVYALCLDGHEASLPEECRATVVATGSRATRVVVRRPGEEPAEDVLADGLLPAPAERVARALAPLRDVNAGAGGPGGLPTELRFLDLAGRPDLGAADVIEGWEAAPGGRSTVALLGVAEDGPFTVDLRRHGPHGLVAGSTGTGKSELLQTLITSLALGNRPDALSFVLVDYKGGAAFKDCVDLPHCVGLVTDLDEHLAERALTSLKAELERRERLLRDAGARDIEHYWALTGGPGPLPRLVLVIDEFATLANEVPRFVKVVADIGMRGRSLGVHVVLATQRPAGNVTAEIQANVTLRLCLGVANSEESTDVIGVPDAARITKATRGRAYARTGHSELTLFQTARVGCPRRTPIGSEALERDRNVNVVPLRLADLGSPGHAVRDEDEGDDGPTDLGLVVEAVAKAAAEAGVTAHLSPWLPPLPHLVTADELPEVGERPLLAVPLGLADHPRRQAQETFVVDLERTGSLLVLGGVRSGRSTVLRTLASGLAAASSPSDVHLYALDFGNRALACLEALPHCGVVVTGDDDDRVERLVTFLSGEVRRRREVLGAGGFGSLAEQRAQAGPGEALPHLVVMVDHMEEFASAYYERDAGRLLEEFERLLREGPAAGITFVVTSDRTGFTARLGSAIESRLVLRQADRDHYAVAGVDPRAVPTTMPAGRGFWAATTTEVQVALLDRDPSGAAQAAALGRRAAEAMARWAGVPADRLPRRIESLPEAVSAEEAERLRRRPRPPGDATFVLGVGGDELEPVDVDLADMGPCFVVAGPPRSGRSTALLAAVASLSGRVDGERDVVAVAPRPSPLRDLEGAPGVRAVLGSGDDLAPRLREAVTGDLPVAVVVDDAELLNEGPAADELERLVRRARDTGVVVLAAATTDDLLLARFRGWLAEARRSRCGLLLSPMSPVDGEVFDLKLPRSTPTGGPPGRGLLAVRGRTRTVQVPVPGEPFPFPAAGRCRTLHP